MTELADRGFLDVGSMRLEYRMIGPRPDAAPTLVLLHEGLGCVGLWGDFPDRLAASTGAGVFVYSRAGYGASSPAELPRPVTFMQSEALEVLPRVLDAIGFQRGLFIGHSDGASIATIYLGNIEDHRVRGLALIAPHFFIEDVGIAQVTAKRAEYATGKLRERLSRWHADVDHTFNGWADVILNPAMRRWSIVEELAYIRVPILIVQGEEDGHGTRRQIEAAEQECYCPVEVAWLPGIGHIPHLDAPKTALKTVGDFVVRLLRDHHESVKAAAAGVASA